MKREAHKIEDVAKLKRIAEAYNTYIERNHERLWALTSLWEPRATLFAQKLAGLDGTEDDIILNDPSVYISSAEKGHRVAKPGKLICKLGENSKMVAADTNEDWVEMDTVFGPNKIRAFSYCIVINLPTYAKTDTTPLAFTRGLREDGTWSKEYGLYGSEGGYVAFVDGHVKWFDGKRPARFLKWDQSGYTSNILEAIPEDACISISGGGVVNYPDGVLISNWGKGKNSN